MPAVAGVSDVISTEFPGGGGVQTIGTIYIRGLGNQLEVNERTDTRSVVLMSVQAIIATMVTLRIAGVV